MRAPFGWSDLAALADRNVHVVGLASTEGAAITRFLAAEGGLRLTVHDFQEGDDLRATYTRLHVGMPTEVRTAVWEELEALPLTRCLGPRYLEGIADADAVFAGQGWYLYPPNFPRLADVRDRGVPFYALMDLYFGLSAAPITAVTGSNGKSTTSRLVEAMLRATGAQVYFGGNERRSVQVLDRLRGMTGAEHLVLEVSNRQLLGLAPTPRVGIVTNVLPNHLAEHGGSFDEYAAAKRRLVQFQAPDAAAVLNADDPASVALAPGLPGRVHWFSLKTPPDRGAWLAGDRVLLRAAPGADVLDMGPWTAAGLEGDHNASNVLAAATGAWLAGAGPDAIAAGMAAFRPLRHRLELVWQVNGTRFYDDLNATSPQATVAALTTLGAPVLWIAGGDDKELALDELVAHACRACRAVLLLPGSGSERLAEALARAPSAPPVTRYDDFRAAVAAAVAAASASDSVLLSPAFPGFFTRHYVDAASPFKALLREIARGVPDEAA